MDLEQTITDAVNDSVNDIEETPTVETPVEPVEAAESPSEPEAIAEPAPTDEVPSPVAVAAPEAAPEEPQDEFAKLVGMPQVGVGGRENRIPYSRVKKITEKQVKEAEAKVAEVVLGRKLNAGENVTEAVKAHVAKLPELTTKVTEYESRLEAVGRFENVMANDPQQFLAMLAKVPAYKDFFEFVESAYNARQGQPAQAGVAAAAEAVNPDEAMPEPDDLLSDGSKVYSLDGVQKLLDWKARQVEARITSNYDKKLQEIDARYKPVVSDWEEKRRVEAALPVIRKQIEEARTWSLFNESEEEILETLRKDPKISLEGAYRQVVFPKLVAERNNVRQEVIKELQTAPVSTSVTSKAAVKPTAPVNSGPRNIEDIIKEQIATIK